MKLVLSALFASVANAACEFNTCHRCRESTGCGWYQTAGIEGDTFGGCRLTADVNGNEALKTTLVEITTCPACQAGSCSDCLNDPFPSNTGCQWLTNIAGIGSYCAEGTATPGVGFSAETICPTCPQVGGGEGVTCATCSDTAGCQWYEDVFGGAGECSDVEPFGKSITVKEACDGNPCKKQQECNSCRALDINGTKPCNWITPKDFYAWAKPAKCDLANAGLVDTALYDVVDTATCPKCSGNTCVSCKAEEGCKFAGVVVAGAYSFGECLEEAATVPGTKEVIDTCREECEIYSCVDCNANEKCAWYDKTIIYNAGCDLRESPKLVDHIGMTPVTTCPKCSFSRCHECRTQSNEADKCGWFMQCTQLLGCASGTGDCESDYTANQFEREIIPENEDDYEEWCPAEVGAAGMVVPTAAALMVAFF